MQAGRKGLAGLHISKNGYRGKFLIKETVLLCQIEENECLGLSVELIHVK